MQPRKATPMPSEMGAPSTRAINRKTKLTAIENEMKLEEREGLVMTDEQKETLASSFTAVKAEFYDLDGLSWAKANARAKGKQNIEPSSLGFSSSSAGTENNPSHSDSPMTAKHKKPLHISFHPDSPDTNETIRPTGIRKRARLSSLPSEMPLPTPPLATNTSTPILFTLTPGTPVENNDDDTRADLQKAYDAAASKRSRSPVKGLFQQRSAFRNPDDGKPVSRLALNRMNGEGTANHRLGLNVPGDGQKEWRRVRGLSTTALPSPSTSDLSKTSATPSSKTQNNKHNQAPLMRRSSSASSNKSRKEDAKSIVKSKPVASSLTPAPSFSTLYDNKSERDQDRTLVLPKAAPRGRLEKLAYSRSRLGDGTDSGESESGEGFDDGTIRMKK